VVLETRSGLQRFDFSCQPSATSSQHAPADRQGRKRLANAGAGKPEASRLGGKAQPPLQTSWLHGFSRRKRSYSSSHRGNCRSSNSRQLPDSSSKKNSSSSYNSSCNILCCSCSLYSYKCTSSSSSYNSSRSNDKGCCSSELNARCSKKGSSRSSGQPRGGDHEPVPARPACEAQAATPAAK
jgi:hypothetical protein